MQERELAGLLIQMGLERDIEIEAIVEELAAQSLPSFVDSQAFRESLVEVAEAQLKRQLDERILVLRQRAGVGEQLQGRVNQPAQQPGAEGGSESWDTDLPESSEPETIVVEDDAPDDATTIWQPPRE